MRTLPLLLIASAIVLLAGADIGLAQPSPSNMRSGTSSGTGGNTTVNLFTVPAGMSFVLTGLDWNPGFTTVGSGCTCACTNVPLTLSGHAPRQAWIVACTMDQGGSFYLNMPLVRSWTTGIAFVPGEPVNFQLGDINALTVWRINWSGYLVAAPAAGTPFRIRR